MGMPPERSDRVQEAIERLREMLPFMGGTRYGEAILTIIEEVERLETEADSAWEQAMGEDA